jgi:hypothetical protein
MSSCICPAMLRSGGGCQGEGQLGWQNNRFLVIYQYTRFNEMSSDFIQSGEIVGGEGCGSKRVDASRCWLAFTLLTTPKKISRWGAALQAVWL